MEAYPAVVPGKTVLQHFYNIRRGQVVRTIHIMLKDSHIRVRHGREPDIAAHQFRLARQLAKTRGFTLT
eukprot:1176600-Pyramimonas_sp.AAC.1